MTEYEKLKNALDHYDNRAVAACDFPRIVAAARAHLETLPRTKFVDVWHVESAGYVTERPMVQAFQCRSDAEAAARENGNLCVRVTGPHKHEVPA